MGLEVNAAGYFSLDKRPLFRLQVESDSPSPSMRLSWSSQMSNEELGKEVAELYFKLSQKFPISGNLDSMRIAKRARAVAISTAEQSAVAGHLSRDFVAELRANPERIEPVNILLYEDPPIREQPRHPFLYRGSEQASEDLKGELAGLFPPIGLQRAVLESPYGDIAFTGDTLGQPRTISFASRLRLMAPIVGFFNATISDSLEPDQIYQINKRLRSRIRRLADPL